MKKMIKFFAISIVLFSLTAGTFAQVTATANASAVIITPITITRTAHLDFGSIAVNASLGTVVITTAGVRSVTGGVTMIGGAPTAATFHITGTAGESYYFNLPANIVLSDGATHTMNVTPFVHTASLVIPVAGTEDIRVGATLEVAGSQVAGTYTNTTDLVATVNYN
jgi:hypothetical protein